MPPRPDLPRTPGFNKIFESSAFERETMADTPNPDASASKKTQPGATLKERRRALSAMVASGAVAGFAMPEKWTAPIVNAVLLPAHGQTSVQEFACQTGSSVSALLSTGSLFVLGTFSLSASFMQSVSDADPTAWTDGWASAYLIHQGTTIFGRGKDIFEDETIGADCTASSALTDGCLISASLDLPAASHSVEAGDKVTVKLVIPPGVVTSCVATVSAVT